MIVRLICLSFFLLYLVAISGQAYKSQAQEMCDNTGDAWACGLVAQGIMLPTPGAAMHGSSADLINKGIAFYSQNRYNEAIQTYDTAINLNPQYPLIWNNKGVALYHQGKYYEAIQAYDMAVKLNPQLAEPWGNMGDSLKALLKYDEAIQAYDRAIELNPQWSGPWIGKSLAFNNQRKADEAKQASDKAIELDPQNALAWYAQGDALLNLGKHDEAIQAYDKTIGLCNENHQNILPDAWGHKGIAFQRFGRIAEANEAFAKARGLGYKGPIPDWTPAEQTTWFDKGIALYNQGKYEEAIKAYDEALRLDPNNTAAWIIKGVALDKQGKYDEAVKAYDEALRLDPNDADLKLLYYNEALRLDPNNTTAWIIKGAAHDAQGEYDEAIKACDEALRLDPNNAAAWNLKGIALNLLDRTSEANAAFAKAKELGYSTTSEELRGTVLHKKIWEHMVNVTESTKQLSASLFSDDKTNSSELLLVFENPSGEAEDARLGSGDLGPLEIYTPEIGPWKVKVYGYEVPGDEQSFTIRLNEGAQEAMNVLNE